MLKSLKELALNISEEEYRNSKEFHYSTLATFDREGFSNLEHLFDKKESPSLLFGSCVDTLLTDGQEAYNNAYMVAEFPNISDKEVLIAKSLFNSYKDTYDSIYKIPDTIIKDLCTVNSYQNNWRPETKVKVIRERCADYYNLLYLAKDKTIISTELNNKVNATVNTLKESEATKWYFQADNPFDDIERCYQLKFRNEYEGIGYMIMADLIVVDHKNKIIYPCDLKTSSHKEYDFYLSYIQWKYFIQAKLYYRTIRANMDRDEYFKDFKLANYRFIVCNGENLDPLVWEDTMTTSWGDLYFGKNKQILMRDPYNIAKELNYYLSTGPKRPIGIVDDKPNNLFDWIDKIE